MKYPTLLAAALFCASICAAQPSVDFRVEGTVVDADTGQPLSGAHLQIGRGPVCQARSQASLTSGDDGTFQAALKTSGPYAVCVQRDGYVTERSLRLTQCSPCRPSFGIHAESKISGRVLSAETKEPIDRMVVEAIRVTDSFDIATSRIASEVRTFPDGQFSLDHLPPGQYFFRFTPANAAPMLIEDGHDATTRPLAVQWWPGGDSARGATPFTVMAGTKFQLPDIWIPALPRYQVSGTVEAAICHTGDAYNVTIGEHRSASIAMLRSMVIRCGAEFSFGDLPPGRYQISLLPEDGSEAVARQEAVITNSDLRKDFPEVHATP